MTAPSFIATMRFYTDKWLINKSVQGWMSNVFAVFSIDCFRFFCLKKTHLLDAIFWLPANRFLLYGAQKSTETFWWIRISILLLFESEKKVLHSTMLFDEFDGYFPVYKICEPFKCLYYNRIKDTWSVFNLFTTTARWIFPQAYVLSV